MINKTFKSLIAILLLAFALVPVQATDYYNVDVGYQGQNDGVWTDFAYGGALAGTEGGDPLDSLEIHLVDRPYASGVEYRVYTTSGWSEWFSTWERATHNNEDILGLQIQLKDFPNANVYYQTYRKGLGWGIWVSNGSTSGQLNTAYPITGFRVKVDEIGVNYLSNINGVTQVLRANGETQGNGSALETVSMNLISAEKGSIEYRAYLRNTGWTTWVSNGSVLGSSGSVIEAIEARLIDLPQYSVQIQPQVEGEWWGYVYDGQTAGAPGINKALTAYRVEIVQRVYVAPTPVVVVETPAIEPIGANPNTTTLTYSAGLNSSIDSDDVSARNSAGYAVALTQVAANAHVEPTTFDDQPGGVYIAIGDAFTIQKITYSVVASIDIPDTFGGAGDNKVHNNQFEVFYGTFDDANDIIYITATPDNTSTFIQGAANHTFIIYDNDTVSNMILDGFALKGLYYEDNWKVTGEKGSRKLEYTGTPDTGLVG